MKTMRLLWLDPKALFFGLVPLLAELRKIGIVEVFTPEDNEAPDDDVEILLLVKKYRPTQLMLNKVPIKDPELIRELAELGVTDVFVTAAGYSNLNVAEMSKVGIRVWNVSDYANTSVAEFVLGNALERLRLLHEHREAATDGTWEEEGQFSYSAGETRLIRGKTVGIIGLGRIGREVAKLMLAVGAKVIAYDKYATSPTFKLMDGVRMVSLRQLYRQSDIITLHAKFEDEDARMIGVAQFRLMKASCIFINAARGGFVDLYALLGALKSGEIAYAVVDTLDDNMEPPATKDQRLIIRDLMGTRRFFLTPHEAWLTKESMELLIKGLVSNVRHAHIHRRNKNTVNREIPWREAA